MATSHAKKPHRLKPGPGNAEWRISAASSAERPGLHPGRRYFVRFFSTNSASARTEAKACTPTSLLSILTP